MSLLDYGPDTVTVFPQQSATDWRDNDVQSPSVVPVTVTGCWMQPVSSGRGTNFDEGQRVGVEYRLIVRDAPVGPWAAVEWTDRLGNTRRFIPLGAPSDRQYSASTSHITVQLAEER